MALYVIRDREARAYYRGDRRDRALFGPMLDAGATVFDDLDIAQGIAQGLPVACDVLELAPAEREPGPHNLSVWLDQLHRDWDGIGAEHPDSNYAALAILMIEGHGLHFHYPIADMTQDESMDHARSFLSGALEAMMFGDAERVQFEEGHL